MNPIQKAFDEWSEPITGGSCDINLSSHGRAFISGYVAGLRNAAKLLNQLHDAEVLKSEPSGFRPRAGSFESC